jgi:hypothetical protein
MTRFATPWVYVSLEDTLNFIIKRRDEVWNSMGMRGLIFETP